jgi:hypothetical protein
MNGGVASGYETCKCGAAIQLTVFTTANLRELLAAFRKHHHVCLEPKPDIRSDDPERRDDRGRDA